MPIPAVPLLLMLITGAAFAQPGGGGPQRSDRQFDHQQLRGELRGAARPQRPSESEPASVATADPLSIAPVRHLTPRERAELRQQLRQELPDARKTFP
ncbi:MAG: hypothetical protein ABIN37_12555 [Burkholderiaceae bacterium]